MQLGEIIALAFNSAARLRRYALAYAACAVLAIVAVFEITSASVLMLEPHLGGVLARLAIAAILVLGITSIIIALRMKRSRPRREAQSLPTSQALPVATLLEVFLLGYSLAQRLSDRKSPRP
jgi:hypothetical protein